MASRCSTSENRCVNNEYLADVIARFRELERRANGALAQVSDDQLFTILGEESNSIAHLMKHLAGNMRSRWTDFLDSDGEKTDRNRDSEFENADTDTPAAVKARFDEGWQILYGALEPLTARDLERIITIRSEPMKVYAAINRQLTHYGYHVGQIVLLAKYFAAKEWSSLSIPRGESESFNRSKRERM